MRRSFVLGVVAASFAASFASPAQGWGPAPEHTVSRWTYAHDVRVRRTLGLRADEAYVASLYSAASAGTLRGGVRWDRALLTSAEERVARERAPRIEEMWPVVLAWGERNDTYGGVFRDGGRIVVLVTRDGSAAREDLLSVVQHPDLLEVRTARYSARDLHAIQHRLERDAGRLGVDVDGTWVDEPRHVVVVNVWSDVDQARRALPILVPEGTIEVAKAYPSELKG